MDIQIRPAADADIDAIVKLVNHYATQNLMLFRSHLQVQRSLPTYLVAVQGERIVACGSLAPLSASLAEVRALAVAPDLAGSGLGSRLVAALVERARELDYTQVCALTLREGFFNRLGFDTVDRWQISAKIWQECIYCAKYQACDEIAVLLNLTEPAAEANQAGALHTGRLLALRALAWLFNATYRLRPALLSRR